MRWLDATPRAPRRWILALTFALAFCVLGTRAGAQESDMLRLAPPIAGLGPIVPLEAPVEIGRLGWGPFRRLCTEHAELRGTAQRNRRTTCLRLEGARDPAGSGWRVRVTPDADPRTAPRFAMLRADDGRVSDITAEAPPGATALSPEQRAGLLTTAHATLTALGIARQRIAPGARFTLPLPGGMDGSGQTRGFDCVAEGRARLIGREAILARCLARLEGALTAQARAEVVIGGHFALDIETGLLLAQSHATRLETFDTTPGRAPRSNGVLITIARTRIEGAE